MSNRYLIGALALAVLSPAMSCDLEDGDAAAYVAQYDYSALADEERAATEQRRLQEFHDKKMAEAKAKFIDRFKVKGQDPVESDPMDNVSKPEATIARD